MVNISIDEPIKNLDDDILGRKKFVDNLVGSITNYNESPALVVGLYGKWGLGKTSIINLMSNELIKEQYKVIKFNPWNFKDQDELLQCFFKDMYAQLKIIDWDKVKSKSGRFLQGLAKIVTFGKYIPGLSFYANTIAPLIKKYGQALNNLSYKKSLEQFKEKISSKLRKSKKKIIVFIDDIDRLNDNEICQIFQLVILVGNFENIVYILSMDKDVIVSALKDSQKVYSDSYLEKIVQLPVQIPQVPLTKIQSVLIQKLNKICEQLKDFLPRRNGDLANTGFFQQFETLRDVNRFINVFGLKFEAIKKNVDFHDFCIISLLEIKFPKVYSEIVKNKEILSGNYSPYERDDSERKKVKQFVDKVAKIENDEDAIFIREALCFLFPKVSQVYSNSWKYIQYHHQESTIRGFIYIKENFDNYFQFGDNELLYDRVQIEEIIQTYSEEKFIDFIKSLNKSNQLTTFMHYIYYYVENKLDLKRSENIIKWLIKCSDEIRKEEPNGNPFAEDCTIQIGYVVKSYLHKNKDRVNVFDFVKNIYSTGNLNSFKVNLLRSLHFENGKEKLPGEEQNKDALLNIQQTTEIDKLIQNDLRKYVCTIRNFDSLDYSSYYYLLKSIDESFCKRLVDKIIKDQKCVLKFVKNFCTRGQLLTGSGGEICGFSMKDQEFDVEKVYNILVKDFNPDVGLDDGDNFYRTVYIMSYEKNNQGDTYTKGEIEKFLQERKNQ